MIKWTFEMVKIFFSSDEAILSYITSLSSVDSKISACSCTPELSRTHPVAEQSLMKTHRSFIIVATCHWSHLFLYCNCVIKKKKKKSLNPKWVWEDFPLHRVKIAQPPGRLLDPPLGINVKRHHALPLTYRCMAVTFNKLSPYVTDNPRFSCLDFTHF